ncbi:hypothetical protein JKA74_02620 [Marivirga sp. S37H4]|uniref:Uncharacterized protein n=1 Tax=Marivirga aurantiaca TaxID=2802615 RepID=A0A934WVQ2_9BACT|nr:DUF6624 domain-containing protein [Marivirga aurantiaca]MBK6263918.1 hypothetical protein [Marivirga aurantiaca]
MKNLLLAIVIFVLGTSCTNNTESKTKTEETKVEFNQELANELTEMAVTDQKAAWIPEGEFKEMSNEEWEEYKDSVFTTHQKRLEEIFNKYGYPGYDLVGEDGSHDFWLMVQHCDFNPEFQQKVLVEMEKEIKKGNASKKNYAYLIDRVRQNTGGKLIYGTQVTYNEFGQAVPKSLEDSLNVNKRRAEVGLEPLEEYLNLMTQHHFEMNKENMINRGITEPKLYKVNE